MNFLFRTYGSVLATSAVVDFSVALSSGLTFAKFVLSIFCWANLHCRVEMLEIYALTGLSNYFGSFLLSIHLFAVALAGHAYFAYNITFCFCYRLVKLACKFRKNITMLPDSTQFARAFRVNALHSFPYLLFCFPILPMWYVFATSNAYNNCICSFISPTPTSFTPRR